MTETTNIRNEENYINSFWDWTPMNDCFLTFDGDWTGIRIGDIDGEVERNGHFLQIETKQVGEIIPLGQIRRIRARVNQGDTIIILYGEPNVPQEMELYKPHQIHAVVIDCAGDIEIVKRIIRGWFLWADANGVSSKFYRDHQTFA
jgi:hypothetical protein